MFLLCIAVVFVVGCVIIFCVVGVRCAAVGVICCVDAIYCVVIRGIGCAVGCIDIVYVTGYAVGIVVAMYALFVVAYHVVICVVVGVYVLRVGIVFCYYFTIRNVVRNLCCYDAAGVGVAVACVICGVVARIVIAAVDCVIVDVVRVLVCCHCRCDRLLWLRCCCCY